MFAKIFESEEYGQILMTKDYDSEEDSCTINFMVSYQNCYVKTAIGVGEEDAQDEIFNSFDLEKAESLISDILP